MKFLYRIAADLVWVIHFFVVAISQFGWLVPGIWYLYMTVLAGTLISLLLLNYCFLSKWEFDLRRKLNSKLSYEFAYASYYTYRLTHGRLSPRFLAHLGLVFTSLSLVINLYFHLLW